MGIQSSYTQATPRGVAGGLVDLAEHSVVSRINGGADGILKFGMGVVIGTNAGSDIDLPVTASTADDFEGVTLNGHTSEMNMAGDVKLANLSTVGVLEYGKVWVRVKNGVSPAYGEKLYLLTTVADAGLFTNIAGTSGTIAIAGRFIGGKGTGDIASVQLYNQAVVTEATSGT